MCYPRTQTAQSEEKRANTKPTATPSKLYEADLNLCVFIISQELQEAAAFSNYVTKKHDETEWRQVHVIIT